MDSYEVTRVYSMRYSGFPSDRNAEMTVSMVYHAPNSKQFSVLSESGSKFIIDHVLKKLLEGEQEAANEENRRQSALTTENYNFTLAGYETSANGGYYVLNLTPRTKKINFLYRGKDLGYDAKDFGSKANRRRAGEKPRPFWIKKTEVKHSYAKGR